MLEICDRNDLCYGGWKQSSFTNTNQFLVLVSLCKAKIRSYDANLVLLLWSISPHAYAHVINFLKIESKSDKNGPYLQQKLNFVNWMEKNLQNVYLSFSHIWWSQVFTSSYSVLFLYKATVNKVKVQKILCDRRSVIMGRSPGQWLKYATKFAPSTQARLKLSLKHETG